MSKTIIFPVDGVKISESLNNEFRIDRVTLISRSKIQRVRSRFGFNQKQWKKLDEKYVSFFNSDTETFAVLRDNSKRNDTDLIKMISEELHILHSIQLPLSRISIVRAWSPFGRTLETCQYHYEITSHGSLGYTGELSNGIIFPLVIDPDVIPKRNIDSFTKILRLLRINLISQRFRSDLRRSMILLGRSITEMSHEIAFLLCCIGLETLIVISESRHREQLQKGIFLLTGGSRGSNQVLVSEAFDQIYDKRCKFVHRGEVDKIDISGVRFSQEMLFNVIRNIALYPKHFPNKQSIADLADQIDCARKLGIESQYWPIRMSYIYTRVIDENQVK